MYLWYYPANVVNAVDWMKLISFHERENIHASPYACLLKQEIFVYKQRAHMNILASHSCTENLCAALITLLEAFSTQFFGFSSLRGLPLWGKYCLDVLLLQRGYAAGIERKQVSRDQ